MTGLASTLRTHRIPMAAPKKTAARGRPPTITRERIADAGIAMTLPGLSFVGVAAALGVSHIALYKHVASLAALRELVAEAIFERWQAPALDAGAGHAIEEDLHAFQRSLRALVDQNPGLAPFLVSHGAKTPEMVARSPESFTGDYLRRLLPVVERRASA